MYCGDELITLVADCGHESSKFGFAGELLPRFCLPSTFRYTASSNRYGFAEGGPVVDPMTEILSLFAEQDYNWSHLPPYLKYVQKEFLRLNLEDIPVLMATSHLEEPARSKQTIETLFESFSCPALYLANRAMLNAYPSPLPPCHRQSSLTSHLLDGPLELRRARFRGEWRFFFLDDMKKSICSVSPSSDISSAPSDTKYLLPDGREIDLSSEKYSTPEHLFSYAPRCQGKSHNSLIYDAVSASPPELRRDFLGSIVVCGGNTLFPGYVERLHSELTSLIPETFKVKILCPGRKQQHFSTWIGGSILASLGSFQQMWVSRSEYQEKGLNALKGRL